MSEAYAVELTSWEYDYLSRKVATDLLCFIGHGDKLFPKEVEQKERVRALSKKFEQ